MSKLDELIEFKGTMRTRRALFEQAHELLDDCNRILAETHERLSKKIAELKAAAPGTLSDSDQQLIEAQLAHEKRNQLLG